VANQERPRTTSSGSKTTRWHRGIILALAGAACVIASPQIRPVRAENALTLAAAMSLRHVMPPLTRAFRDQDTDTGAAVHVNYGASGNLRKQVEGGAPVDVVVFADAVSVDALIANGDVDTATRHVVATNTLVLIGAPDARPLTFETLADTREEELISIGEPGAVPAGRYARSALRNLGVWEALQGRIVFGGHVGAVLSYVRRGEVAAAIVYATETREVTDVKVLDRARSPWTPTPEIVSAVTTESTQTERSHAFVAFLRTPEARAIFTEHGFGIP